MIVIPPELCGPMPSGRPYASIGRTRPARKRHQQPGYTDRLARVRELQGSRRALMVRLRSDEGWSWSALGKSFGVHPETARRLVLKELVRVSGERAVT